TPNAWSWTHGPASPGTADRRGRTLSVAGRQKVCDGRVTGHRDGDGRQYDLPPGGPGDFFFVGQGEHRLSAARAQLVAKHVSLRHRPGDARLRTELVEEYTGFAISLARKF